jgi:hypothetical protein
VDEVTDTASSVAPEERTKVLTRQVTHRDQRSNDLAAARALTRVPGEPEELIKPSVDRQRPSDRSLLVRAVDDTRVEPQRSVTSCHLP